MGQLKFIHCSLSQLALLALPFGGHAALVTESSQILPPLHADRAIEVCQSEAQTDIAVFDTPLLDDQQSNTTYNTSQASKQVAISSHTEAPLEVNKSHQPVLLAHLIHAPSNQPRFTHKNNVFNQALKQVVRLMPFTTTQELAFQAQLETPRLIARYATTLLSLNESRVQILNNHLYQQRSVSRQSELLNTANHTPKAIFFGGYLPTKQSHIHQNRIATMDRGTMGGTYYLSPKWSMGGMVSMDAGYQSKQIQSRYDSVLASIFGQYTETSGFWSYIDLYYGKTQFDAINEISHPVRYQRTAETYDKAVLSGMNLRWGYDIQAHPLITMGPTLGLTRNQYQFYSRSASNVVHNKKQIEHIMSAGWNMSAQMQSITPYFQVAYHRNLSYKNTIKPVTTTAMQQVYFGRKNRESWVDLSLGADASFSSNLAGYANMHYIMEGKKSQSMAYSVGMSLSF